MVGRLIEIDYATVAALKNEFQAKSKLFSALIQTIYKISMELKKKNNSFLQFFFSVQLFDLQADLRNYILIVLGKQMRQNIVGVVCVCLFCSKKFLGGNYFYI
jgi:hypothetical protein